MSAGQVTGGQEEVGDPLFAVEMAVGAGEVVTAVPEGRDFEEAGALREVADHAAGIGETDVEERATGEIRLVADGAHVERLPVSESRLRRGEKTEAVTVGLGEVEEEAAGEDVGGGEVHLEAGEIGAGEAGGPVLSVGKPVDRVVGIEEVEAVVKPGAAFDEWPREFQARCPLVEVPAAIARDAGDEIGAGKAEGVVAHFGLQADDA